MNNNTNPDSIDLNLPIDEAAAANSKPSYQKMVESTESIGGHVEGTMEGTDETHEDKLVTVKDDHYDDGADYDQKNYPRMFADRTRSSVEGNRNYDAQDTQKFSKITENLNRDRDS